MTKHIGSVAGSSEAAALCYRMTNRNRGQACDLRFSVIRHRCIVE